MTTSKEYTENLKKGIITEKMLELAAVSVNVRAKRARDKEREYRNRYDKYNNEEIKREIKEEYYRKKELLLSIVPISCLHKEQKYRYEKCYAIDYRPSELYDDEKEQAKKEGRFVREGFETIHSDADRYIPDDGIEEALEDGEIFQCPYFVKKEPLDKSNYYLFYEIGEHSFHSKPLTEEEVKKYEKQYKMVEIDEIHTEILDIQDLASTKFVNQIIGLIKSGNFQFVKEN